MGRYESYVLEVNGPLTDSKIDGMSKIMSRAQDLMAQEIRKISSEFGVSDCCASAIYYLRTRKRWSQDKENDLIELGRSGKPMPNLNEF